MQKQYEIGKNITRLKRYKVKMQLKRTNVIESFNDKEKRQEKSLIKCVNEVHTTGWVKKRCFMEAMFPSRLHVTTTWINRDATI